MRSVFSAVIAISVGIITLLGYFIPVPLLQNLRLTFIDWAIILAGVAGLVAIIHLTRVHWNKATAEQDKDVTSWFLLLAFIITFAAGMILKPNHPAMQKVVTHIQVPFEASLMGILSIFLIVAAVQFFRRRHGVMSLVFAASAFIFLVIGSGVLAGAANMPYIKEILTALNTLPIAGARGILLGVALGSLTTGLRILLGSDRPYSG
ncbi:MAG: hypothetical protein ACYC6H_05550 [Bellilinea sp.]